MTTTIGAGKNGERASRFGKVAERLGFAASPTFALMAGSAARAPSPDPLCTSTPGQLSVDSRVWMYLLMGLFHIPPWLRLFSVRAEPLTHSASPVEGD